MVGDLLAFLLAESTASFLFSLLFVIWLISKVVGWFGSDRRLRFGMADAGEYLRRR